MQIFHRLFKASSDNRSRSLSEQRVGDQEGHKTKPRELVIYDKGNKEGDEKPVTIQLNREESRALFYSTLRLKLLKRLYEQVDNQSEVGELVAGLLMGHKADSVSVGCKVLPICDAGSMGSISDRLEKEAAVAASKGERRKAASRMKELLRWAAAAKSHKGGSKGWKVLYFRNKVSLRDPLDDGSSTSSKISFKWDVGSCSTSSSVFSPLSLASASRSDQPWAKNNSSQAVSLQSTTSNASTLDSPKNEGCGRLGPQWITTDSDFVVLEL